MEHNKLWEHGVWGRCSYLEPRAEEPKQRQWQSLPPTEYRWRDFTFSSPSCIANDTAQTPCLFQNVCSNNINGPRKHVAWW